MDEQHTDQERGKIPTEDQVSAGGVVFRPGASGPEIALILVGERARWQLPKGLVDAGEPPEQAALREVREEAGLEAELIAPIDVIEYWYVGIAHGQRRRFHKFVHFFLLAYRGGDVGDHDWEVREARWVSLEEALHLLAFKSERTVVERASVMIAAHH